MRRRSLYTAVFLLAVTLSRCGSRASAADTAAPVSGARVVIASSASAPVTAPAAANVPPATPAPAPAPGFSPKQRLIVATSARQPAPRPVVPVPDDGLKLWQVPGGSPPTPTPAPPPGPAPGGLQLAAFHVPPADAPPPTVPEPPLPSRGAEYTPPSVPAPGPGPGVTAAPAPAPASPSALGRTVSLYLETVGPASQGMSRPFTYEILVRNPGPAPAAGVKVQDVLPEQARCLQSDPPAEVHGQRLGWDLGRLEAGAERRLRVEVQAGREGKFEDLATATCSVSHSVGTDIQRPRLALAIAAPARAGLGQAVPFQLRVTNNGTGPATHVLVHGHLSPGLKHPQGENVEAEVGTLAPGTSKTVTLQTTAVQGGRQVHEAVASADEGLEAPASAAVEVAAAVLAVRKTGPKETGMQRELEHRLEVVNTGTAPATGVRLTDTLPAGLELLAAGDGGAYTAATRSVDWVLGTLAPGQTRAVSLRLLARKPGDWVNQALARADWGLEARAGAPVHVEGIAALMLRVVDLVDPVEVGGETTYEVRVVNQGTGACSRVQVQAVVPDGMIVVAAEPAAHRVEGQRVVFEPVARLAARAEAVFRVRAKAKTPGDWRFRAYLGCDQLQRPVCKEESTQVFDGGDDPPPGPAPPRPGGAGGKPADIPKRE